MKKLTGITAAAFALAIATLLTACSGGGKQPAGDTRPPASTTEAETVTETTTKYADNLPDDLDFDGGEVRVLYREANVEEFYIPEATGEIVDDAINDSIREVEERLNLKVAVTPRIGTAYSDRLKYNDHIAQNVLAGDDVYEWCDIMADMLRISVGQGVLADLQKVPYLEPDKPWYTAGLTEEGILGGGLWCLLGDFSLGYLRDTFCLYFNKTLTEAYGVEDLYKTVEGGDWTIDRAAEVSKKAASDVNGDGIIDLEDKLGFVLRDNYHLCGFMTCTDVNYYSRDSAGGWQYTYGSEHDIKAVTKVHSLLRGTPGNYLFEGTRTSSANQEVYNSIASKFMAGEVMIMTAQMNDAVTDLRNMESDYGILPFPKLDEAQEDYITSSRTTHSAMVMPLICSEKGRETAGAFIEALAAKNHGTVIPAYFELALKTKYSRDNESTVMYDLIHDSTRLSFSYLYAQIATKSPTELFIAGCKEPDKFASSLAAAHEANKASFDQYIKSVEEINK